MVCPRQVNPVHELVAGACENGEVRFWDLRSRRRVGMLDLGPGVAGSMVMRDRAAAEEALADLSATTVAYAQDGLGFAVGTSSGHCLLYDLRSSRPLHVKVCVPPVPGTWACLFVAHVLFGYARNQASTRFLCFCGSRPAVGGSFVVVLYRSIRMGCL